MKARLFLSIISLSISSIVYADSWGGPHIKAIVSDDSSIIVRIIPAGTENLNKPQAVYYNFNGKSYIEINRFNLKNKIAPVASYVSNEGNLITFDDFPHLGRGKVIYIYKNSGELIKSYRLEDLYSPERLELIKEYDTISSIHWRCGSAFFNRDELFLSDSLNGYFIINQNYGIVAYSEYGGYCDGSTSVYAPKP